MNDAGKMLLLSAAKLFVAMGEDHADAVFAGRRQGKSQHPTFPSEKAVRNLYQNAGTVAALGIGTFGTAVFQIF